MIQNILVLIDFSDCSKYAAQIAVDLAKKANSKIHLLHVIKDSNLNTELQLDKTTTKFNEFVKTPLFKKIDVEWIIKSSHIYSQIINYEKRHDIDLIVMGTTSDPKKISTLTKLVKSNSQAPVLTVRSEFYRKKNDDLQEEKDKVEHQKEVVEIAHHQLEERTQEIVDSITYAKRIQSAILPPNKVVKKYLKKSFIFYKPKDIVAGDFYWIDKVFEKKSNKQLPIKNQITSSDSFQSQNSNDLVFFAAADCTGHGVPGAIVSVICNNALNQSVREQGLTDPGKILNKTREIIIQEFEESDEDVKDGMDIALCSLKGYTLQYSGANNPLWIVHKSKQNSESNREILNQTHLNGYTLTDIKANKQPIGNFENPQPFITHTFELEKEDTIYIFSDGYVDQFGGPKNKKFKAKAFKKLLLSIQNETMEKQKQLIDSAFETWKGNLEQIDDVCVIGVRV